MNADNWDLSKENVQPLRQGRRAGKLGLALLALSDTDANEQLLKEREEHELEIMTYDGPDPLEPRYAYVQWIEQSCPKHGREVNLIPLLEDTIMQFKEDDRYKQDTRFIELIIKYIETQDNPVELFQMVFAQGLGTKCASFYKTWADQLDLNNDFQRADQIFQLGLSNGAEPRNVLEQAQVNFQMSVARRMMMGQLAVQEKTVSTETAERQRRVLGKIKKGGTHRPSSGLPGKVPLLVSNRSLSSNSTTPFAIYQEDENGQEVVPSRTKAKLNVNSATSKKENTVKPTTWNHGFKQRPHVPPTPSTPSFKVLMDEEEDETPRKPIIATPVPTNVLKIRKADFTSHARELFTSPHPSNKPHLPIFEAFAGGKEFSFEELRWAYLSKKTGPGRNGSMETPIKPNRNFTPCKSSSTPAVETPLRPAAVDPHDRTPARAMYPIMESPTIITSDSSAAPSRLDLDQVDGVYAIPNTPAGQHKSSLTVATPSTCSLDPDATPLISRPKLFKPTKPAPFVIYTDE